MSNSHKCDCTGAGFCQRFQRHMDERQHHICQTANTSPLRMQIIAQLYATTPAGICAYKGDPLTDSHGFARKRSTCGGCGNSHNNGPVMLYQCNFPSKQREAEDHCESRCSDFLPRTIQPQADSISLTVTESTQTAESVQTISD